MKLGVLPGLGEIEVGAGVGAAGEVEQVGRWGIEQVAGICVVVVGFRRSILQTRSLVGEYA